MKPRPPLFTSEPEALGGNGPSNIIPLAEAAPAAAESAPVAEAAPEAKPPTFLEQVRASIQSKGALISQVEAATLRATTAEGQLALANAENATLRAKVSAYETERAEITAALTTAKAEVKGEELAAAAQVASLGFEANKLPAAETIDAKDTLQDLEARLETETDPKEIVRIARQIDAQKAKIA